VFEAVAAAGGEYGGIYLVGGTVRDILLGEESFDVDVAVEGDAISFARRLAAELGGTCRPHEQFGTAVVFYGEGEHIDVVTARTERYAASAALPTVEPSTIQDDLFRRDFTINALAASLLPGDFGRLVDPFGGRDDLGAGTIRVLHDRSFVDDPTRIFRAIRYENRYGFRMDARTETLAREAVESGLVGQLSAARLTDELVALLSEAEVAGAIRRLAELGVDHALHPRLAADEEAVELSARLEALKRELDVDAPDWRLRLAVLARRLEPGELAEWLEGLELRRRDLEQIAAAVTIAPRLVEALAGTPDPAEIVALAEPHAPDAPLVALALADVPALRAYFDHLRQVRLDIDGTDLAALGLAESPQVGEILAELRRRKLRGELDGREAELAAARELIGGGG
jgi:tRNA nucleotidyltransferase (CCA-adding enzyme)